MNLSEIAGKIKAGELFNIGNTLLTKEQHDAYQAETKQAEYYDMLQGVWKVLL